MDDLQNNISYLRQQIENTYEGYEKILNDCMKSALNELNNLHNKEKKIILSQSSNTVVNTGSPNLYEKPETKIIQYNSYIWNSDLGQISKLIKNSFGFFSSEIRTTNTIKSLTGIKHESVRQHSPRVQADVSSNAELLESNKEIAKHVNKSFMQIRCKFGRLGYEMGQFNTPHGFCLGLQEEVFIADTHNHRIQVFEKNGTFLYQFGTAGKDKGEIWYPRKIAVIKSNGNFVICDRGNKRSRMQVFTGEGDFVREIALDFIDIVSGLVTTEDGNIVVADSVKSTLFIISEFGNLINSINCSDYVLEPSDIAVWRKYLYVCDFKGHCVVVYTEAGSFIRKIGHENITKFPNGIDISDEGDILIGDSHGNKFHIALFNVKGFLLSEFECPHVKLSRCCGLKLTSEGYVISLAKNNHHALVLNTLYVQ